MGLSLDWWNLVDEDGERGGEHEKIGGEEEWPGDRAQFGQYAGLARRLGCTLFFVTVNCDESVNKERLTSLERVRGIESLAKYRKGERQAVGFDSGSVSEGQIEGGEGTERNAGGGGGGGRLGMGKVENKVEGKGKLIDPNVPPSIRAKFELLDPEVVGKKMGSKRSG
ncbi:hypothetical protein IFR04_013114 [Cadophora malorum]|uniref:Uncharacterized protein n=1 Tax=Cadophora malorum TaxID=108018 RepID=A0A8H7T226_9HELO|nr:hypothetical protein IFR04_013114 [Cadophora malorum]